VIRTYLANDYIKRTIRPLYSWTQATPKPAFLDPAWTRAIPIWPGMGFVRTGGDLVAPAGATTAQMGSSKTMNPQLAGTNPIYGLGALYIGGDGVDELLYAGINAFAVWVLAADAEFEILAPAFDTTGTYVDPTDGSGSALLGVALTSGSVSTVGLPSASTLQGQLVPWNNTASGYCSGPVARLLKVNSSTKITIGGLEPYTSVVASSYSGMLGINTQSVTGRD
jgi:hypothetical protein